jgi:hypothetical protein
MYKYYSSLILASVALIFALGCSGNGGSPVLPDENLTNPVPHGASNEALLGFYEIELDCANGTANVVPLRGPSFQVNVVKFLQPPVGNPANLGVHINPDGTDVSIGLIDLDVSVTHPFPGSNVRGFDVRGIVFGDKATEISTFDYEVSYPKPTELRLLNPMVEPDGIPDTGAFRIHTAYSGDGKSEGNSERVQIFRGRTGSGFTV